MCTNDFGAATHNERRFQFQLLKRLFRVLPGFMGKSLVIAVKNQQTVTTKLAHVHAQSEFTYDGYLAAAEHL